MRYDRWFEYGMPVSHLAGQSSDCA